MEEYAGLSKNKRARDVKGQREKREGPNNRPNKKEQKHPQQLEKGRKSRDLINRRVVMTVAS